MTVDLGELEDHYNLPKGLLSLVEKQESGGDANAVSPAGALGAFQFMPATAAQYGIDPIDPDQAAQGAAHMYGDLLKKYKGDVPSALAAYNWGQGNVDNQGLANAPAETQKYVTNIMNGLGQQQQQSGGVASAIGDFLMPSAQAEEMPKNDFANSDVMKAINPPKDSSPYDNMSDDQLLLEAKRQGIQVQPPDQKSAYDGMSNEQLLLEAKRQGIPITAPGASKPGDLPEGNAAYPGVLATAVGKSGDEAADAFNTVSKAFLPITALARMTMGKDLTPEEKDYLDKGDPVSPMADVASGFGKGALAALSMAFAPVSAANRAYAGNPIENATGIPSGATDFALSMVEPYGAEKLFGLAGKALSKIGDIPGLAESADMPDQGNALSQVSQPTTSIQKVDTTPLDVANAAKEQITGNSAAQPQGSQNLPMSAGQSTQNPDLQRIEADSLAGSRGPAAQSEALNFVQKQQNAVNDMFQSITQGKPGSPSFEAGGNPTDSVNNVVNLVKANEAKASADVDQAYKTARDLSDGLTLPKGDMSQNLVPEVQKFAKDFGIKPQTTPKAASQLDDLIDLSKQNSGKALLDDGETWRRATTNLAANSTDPADAKALRGLVTQYDQYTADLADRLSASSFTATSGNQKAANAINAFKEAVATRRDYGNTFEGNDFVENVINGKKSGDDLAQDLIGNNVGNKQGMLDNLNSTLRAAGQQAPLVKAQLQKAYAQQIYNTVSGNKIAGSAIDAISLPKLQTALQNTFVKNREFATSLYGSDAVDSATQAIEQLKLINSKQANVGNPSSSGYTIARLMASPASAPIHMIPFLGDALAHVGEAGRNAQNAAEATETFAGKVPKSFKPNQPRTKTAGAALAVSGASDNE